MEILPVIQPHINWQYLASVCREHTGESPTREHDLMGLSLGDPASLVVAFGDQALTHCFFSFLCAVAPTEYTVICTLTRTICIHRSIDSVLCLVTANLYEWKLLIQDNPYPEYIDKIRVIFEKSTALKRILSK